ncbi:MAG TPA: hypothetical protein VE258_10340, partial [Ktedonobacterales bacterium]|nr:hypothetical protein [Ktedonobacterales bacterium]
MDHSGTHPEADATGEPPSAPSSSLRSAHKDLAVSSSLHGQHASHSAHDDVATAAPVDREEH